jgi:hypothetical protein
LRIKNIVIVSSLASLVTVCAAWRLSCGDFQKRIAAAEKALSLCQEDKARADAAIERQNEAVEAARADTAGLARETEVIQNKWDAERARIFRPAPAPDTVIAGRDGTYCHEKDTVVIMRGALNLFYGLRGETGGD